MVYGRGGNDGVLLCRSGKHIRTAHWSASPHHSPLSHYHQHQLTTPTLTCLLMTLRLVWITSSACFTGSLPPFPLLTTRLQPALQLLVLGVVRLPNLPVLPASLVRQSPPLSPSMSTVTSFAGGIVTSPILFSLRSVDELRARLSAMIDSRTSI